MKFLRKINFVFLFLILIGILDVFLRWWICGTTGLRYALHDPGKVIFHIFLIPYAYFIFTRKLSVAKARELLLLLRPKNRWGLVILSSLLLFLGVILTYNHENKTRCAQGFKKNTFIMPYDVRPAEEVDTLLNIRESIYDNLERRQDLVDRLTEVSMRRDSQAIKPIISKINDLDLLNDTLKDRYKLISHQSDGINCTVLSVGSIASIVGLTETILAVIFVAMLLSAVLLVNAVPNNHPSVKDASIKESLALVGAVLAPWIPLRVYSETYINFASVNYKVLSSVIILLVVFAVFLIMIYAFRSSSPSLRRIVVFAYPIAAGIYNILISIDSNLLIIPFFFIYGLGWAGTALIFLVLSLPFFMVLFSEDHNL